jgi:hypothetical protein
MKNKKERNWSEKPLKEKLDLIFVIVAIVGFSLSAYVNIKVLTKN